MNTLLTKIVLIYIFVLSMNHVKCENKFVDKVVDGLISFGRGFGDATKSVVTTFQEWGDKVKPPQKVIIKDVEVEPILARICGLDLVRRRTLTSCLSKDEHDVVQGSWPSCIGRAKAEVQSFEELMHFICNQIENADNLRGFEKMQKCIFKDIQLDYAMSLFRLCRNKIPL